MQPTGVGEEPTSLFFRFNATKIEPDYAHVFMELGGAIGAAASNWETDMSLTSSKESVVSMLDNETTREISIEIPREKWKFAKATNSSPECILLPQHLRLNSSTSRMAPAINGTLVTSISGQGSAFVVNLLKQRGHSQVGMVYKSWMAHSACLGISGARIVSVDDRDQEREHIVVFESRPERLSQILEASTKLINAYVEQAWQFRQNVVYRASPMLTKTVFKEMVGANGQGYSLLHDVVERGSPLSLKALNAVFKIAIEAECLYEKQTISHFLSATRVAGVVAASQARVVASATSKPVVNFMMAYRADGRNFISVQGADFAQAESWPRQQVRNACQGDDCDGSSLLAVGVLNATRSLSAEQLQDPELQYLRAVRNAVHPYYQVGICVLGATAGEASSLGNDRAEQKAENVAGHAIAVMMPTLGFLRALQRGMHLSYGPEKVPLVPPESVEVTEHARFAALFTEDVKSELPPLEQKNLKNWAVAQSEFEDGLVPYAVEGTTPASSVLYLPDPEQRASEEREARKDDMAFAKASPNVFRSIKRLHVGGSVSGSTHRFYRDLVEVTFPRSSPLYADQILRGMTTASTQFVLSRQGPGDELKFSGATPKDVVLGKYTAVPMVTLGAQVSEILDVASVTSSEDVVAKRAEGPMILTEFESASLAQSMQHVNELAFDMNNRSKSAGHQVVYISAYSTLVHNPKGVSQFCKTIASVASCGAVDISLVEDLAVTHTGDQAGYFVTVCVNIPL